MTGENLRDFIIWGCKMIEIEKLDKWQDQIELDRSKLLDIHSFNYLLLQHLEDMGGRDRTYDGIGSPGQSLIRAIETTTKEILSSTGKIVHELMDEKRAMRDAKAKADRTTDTGLKEIMAKLEKTSKAIYDKAMAEAAVKAGATP